MNVPQTCAQTESVNNFHILPETTDGWYRIGALDFFHQESSGIIGPFSVPKLFRLAAHYNWGITQPLQSLALISEMHQKY